MKSLLLFAVIIFLLLSTKAMGMDERGEVFLDEYNPNVNVSGGFFVGAMFPTKIKKMNDFMGIYTFIPTSYDKSKDKICLEISSIDGKYEGLFSWERDSTSYVNKISLDTDHEEKIKEYTPDDIVILASIQKNCERKSKKVKYVPAKWGEPSKKEEDKSVDIYLNSGTRETYIETTYSGAGKERTIELCQTIEAQDKVAYNTKCSIKISGVSIKKLRFLRKEPGEEFLPKKFRLLLKE